MASTESSALIANCVYQLGSVIGERNDRDPERYERLGRARDSIVEQLAANGGEPRVLPCRSQAPGANDNGTGLAFLLALAHLLSSAPLECPVRLVAFANEYHRPSDSVAHTPTGHLSEVTVACSRAMIALSKPRD